MRTRLPSTKFAAARNSPPMLALLRASPLIALRKCVNTSLVVLVWFGRVLRYATMSACVKTPPPGAGEGDLPPALRRFEPSASESEAAPSVVDARSRLRLPLLWDEEDGAGEVARLAR